MNIAFRGATRAVEREQRIDFERLRTHRPARMKATLAASGLVGGRTYVRGADIAEGAIVRDPEPVGPRGNGSR